MSAQTIPIERPARAHAKHAVRVASPWSQLESTDLAVYAANLRAVGCPPKTVRDILLPLIEKKFGPDALPVSAPTRFWASFSQRQSAAITRAEQERGLEQQKEKMLKELFGFAWNGKELNEACSVEAAGTLGFLDCEQAQKFLCMLDRYKTQVNDFNLSSVRSADSEAWRQAAGEVLSPTEIDEAELRGILTIFQRRDPNLCNAGLNGAELRQLMAFRRELRQPLLFALYANDDTVLEETDWAGEHQFLARVRALLGDSRFIDYLNNCDESIQRTLSTLEQEHLPRGLALQLFDLREEAIARAQEIRQWPVHRVEKRAQLGALRENALERLAALPNSAIDTRLLEINQEWLQEIAKP